VSQPREVLHLASWYPFPEEPRLGNFVARHVEVLSFQHRAWVLAARAGKQNALVFSREGEARVLRVYFRPYLPWLSLLWALYRGYRFLKRKGMEEELIHLHVAYPAGILSLFLQCPLLISEHFSGYHPQRGHRWNPGSRWLARRIFNRAEVICPVSAALGQTLRDFGVRAPLLPVGNAVNTAVFRYHDPVKKRGIRILHLSSLQDSTKNITGMVKVMRTFLGQHPEVTWAVGGDGDPHWLADQLAVLPAKQVEQLPALSPEEVAEQMKQADAFMLFSWIENQPVVILEALCSGRPVIASRVGGIEELIGPAEGLLVERGNEEGLIQALEELLQRLPWPEGEALARKAAAEHGDAAIAAKFAQAYLSALRSSASDHSSPGPDS